MLPPSSHPHKVERSLIAIVVVLILFLSPLTEFWANLDAPWYSPYLVWSLAIFISWLLQRYLRSNTE